MKTSRFTKEPITRAVRQAEAGTPVPEICRNLGVSGLSLGAQNKLREAGRGVSGGIYISSDTGRCRGNPACFAYDLVLKYPDSGLGCRRIAASLRRLAQLSLNARPWFPVSQVARWIRQVGGGQDRLVLRPPTVGFPDTSVRILQPVCRKLPRPMISWSSRLF